jgi:alpha-glucosidase (family GH31 glycosyl hydrolase)
VIHSSTPHGQPPEPWSYRAALDAIRELVEMHYEFMPYIYNTAVQSAATGIPMERPFVLMFPEDGAVNPDSIHYMFGQDLLVLSAVEEGEEQVDVYQPGGQGWFDPESGDLLEGGRRVSLDYPCRGARYLIREGSVIFRAPGCRKLDTGYFESLSWDLYPAEGSVEREYIEDNGEDCFAEGSHNRYRILMELKDGEGSLELRRTACAGNSPAGRTVDLTLPEGFAFGDGLRSRTIGLDDLDGVPVLRFVRK